jgi:hypothetical protein
MLGCVNEWGVEWYTRRCVLGDMLVFLGARGVDGCGPARTNESAMQPGETFCLEGLHELTFTFLDSCGVGCACVCLEIPCFRAYVEIPHPGFGRVNVISFS